MRAKFAWIVQLLQLFLIDAWISNHRSSRNIGTSQLHTATTAAAEVIGGGRIGSFLASAGDARLLGRGDSIDPNQAGNPILICTRNDSLEAIIQNCPKERRSDLVFLQNGYLDGLLQQHNLMDNTQVLLYLSIPSLGATPVDGVTSFNPEGLTTAVGKHASAFAERLQTLNMKCNVVDAANYRPAMFEKLIWICTYMLVGTAKDCKSVGEAGVQHKELVEQVISELMVAVQNAEGISFAPGTLQRLAAYTDVVADFPCGVKEFEWRNQYFYQLDCPTHNGLLEQCAKDGKLGFELPPK